jgi:hypothetical protein
MGVVYMQCLEVIETPFWGAVRRARAMGALRIIKKYPGSYSMRGFLRWKKVLKAHTSKFSHPKKR